MFGYKLVKETRWNGVAKKAVKLWNDYNEKLHDYMNMECAVRNAIHHFKEGDEEEALRTLEAVVIPFEDCETKLYPNYNLMFFPEEFTGKRWHY